MRRIGTELGMPTMSLYTWIRGRDELTLQMINATMGKQPWPQPPPGWRAQLEYVRPPPMGGLSAPPLACPDHLPDPPAARAGRA